MYQSLILSKSLPCLKCEQLYQRFASPPASGPSLPLDFLSYLALLHIPPWAHPLCNRALMLPPLSFAPVSVPSPGYTPSPAASGFQPIFEDQAERPLLRLGVWWGVRCGAAPVVLETSFTTTDPQEYSVLPYIHDMSSLLGSGLAEKRRGCHSSLFLLSHLWNHCAQSSLRDTKDTLFGQGWEEDKPPQQPLPSWGIHWWGEGGLSRRLERGSGHSIRRILQSAIKPYDNQRWSPCHFLLLSPGDPRMYPLTLTTFDIPEVLRQDVLKCLGPHVGALVLSHSRC